jgi:multiple antibiotic resistance protein
MMEFALASFIALLVTMNPLETAALFSALTRAIPREDQKWIALKSTLIAAGLLALFALVGDDLLRVIGISLAGVRVGGGILLMLVAIELVFGHPATTTGPGHEHGVQADLAVFPLAMPIIAGPAAITAVVVKSSEANNHLLPTLLLFAALAVVLFLSWAAMVAAGFMHRWLGDTGMNVITRVLGTLLAALAAELVLTGLRESGVFK